MDNTIERYQPFIINTVYKWCNRLGVRNKQNKEDCLQECYIKILENINDYDKEKNISIFAYLAMLIKSRAIDYKKVLDRNTIETISYIEEIEDKSITEDKIYIHEIKPKLTSEEFDIFKMYFIEGYTQDEISKRKNCSRISITRLIAIILEKIKVDN